MISQNKVHLSLFLALLAVCVCTSGCGVFTYTGDIFSTRPGSVNLCATSYPPAPSIPVSFYGITPFGITFRFDQNPVLTDYSGKACLRANIFPGVYVVQPSPVSPPKTVSNGPAIDLGTSVLTVFSPYNVLFHGVVGGGQITLNHDGVPPSVQPAGTRKATFGLMAKLNQPGNFQFAYVDAVDATYAAAVTYTYLDLGASSASFRGPVSYELSGGSTSYGQYELSVSDSPGGPLFNVSLYDLTGSLVYQSGLSPEEQQVSKGRVLFVP